MPTLAGHVHVGDWVIMSGFAAVHQFCKIGAHALVAVQARPVAGRAAVRSGEREPGPGTGINIEGLQRRGYTPERIAAVKQMHKLLYRQGLTLAGTTSEIAKLRDEHPVARDDVDLVALSLYSRRPTAASSAEVWQRLLP